MSLPISFQALAQVECDAAVAWYEQACPGLGVILRLARPALTAIPLWTCLHFRQHRFADLLGILAT